jgi:ribosomal protein S27E
MILKARCAKCGHLIVWDEERYSKQNHVVGCKGCGEFLAGGFRCNACGTVIKMLNPIAPEWCPQCRAPYDPPLRESI